MAGNKEGAILYKKVLKVIFTLLSIGMMLYGIVFSAITWSMETSDYTSSFFSVRYSQNFYGLVLVLGLIVSAIFLATYIPLSQKTFTCM